MVFGGLLRYTGTKQGIHRGFIGNKIQGTHATHDSCPFGVKLRHEFAHDAPRLDSLIPIEGVSPHFFNYQGNLNPKP